MGKGKRTSRAYITFEGRIARCRNYVRDESRPLDEVLDEFLSFWREVSAVLSGYEAAHRLLSQLPSDLEEWAESLLSTLVRANPFTLDPHVDLEFFVASVKAKVCALEQEEILNERKAKKAETKADLGTKTTAEPSVQTTTSQPQSVASRAQQLRDEQKALDKMLEEYYPPAGHPSAALETAVTTVASAKTP